MDDERELPSLLMARGSELCTEPQYRFLRRHYEIFDEMFFTNYLAQAADSVREKAITTLYDASHPSRVNLVKNPKPNFERLIGYANYRSEVVVVFSVDNFLCYLSEVVQLAAKKRPEVLKSRSQISVEDALRFSSKRDLVDFIINTKINELSYGGVFAIEEFLESRTKTSFPDDLEIRSRLNFAVELRNIYVHSRGVVNELFVSRLKFQKHGFDFTIGKRFHADFDKLCLLTNSLFETAVHIDNQLAEKFAISRKKYKTWDQTRKSKFEASIQKLREGEQANDKA